MKMRNKGKVHPFTSSSSSSSSSSPNTDSLSVLKLLPAAVLTLVSFLSLEDREVYAYMITRSLKSTNPTFFPANYEDKKKSSKKPQCGHNSPPLFDCDCFHCYTCFWFRWDSSPNRELIHQAIELFEEHLNSGGDAFKSGKTRRRDRLGRRRTEKLGADAYSAAGVLDSVAAESPENLEPSISAAVAEAEPTVAEADEVGPGDEGVGADEAAVDGSVAVAAAAPVVRSHKGLARKVLPDVMGIFSSRLWSLWSPNV